MENIENLVERRQRLVSQKKEIEDQIASLSDQIVDEIGEFKGSQEIAGYQVSVTTRRTFKGALAEKMLTKKRMNKQVRDSLYERKLDSKKVKALFPDVYDEASVKGATFVTVKEL